MHKITIMSKPECSLCDAAVDAVQRVVGTRVAAVIEVVDVTQDLQLLEKYRLTLPVILVNGVERFHGQIDINALAKLFYDDPAQRLLGFF